MGLSDHRVSASIAVSDITEARTFYEGKLGLSGVEDPQDESWTYACGSGTSLHVFPSPRAAGSTSTRATWIDMLGAGKVAWFKDPDGNTFAVEQRPATGP